eukprot:gene19057-6380_t
MAQLDGSGNLDPREGKKWSDEEKLAEAKSNIKLMCADDIINTSDKT